MARVVKIIKNAAVKFGPLPTPPAAIDPATLTDYGCQTTEARVTASANAQDVPATFCEPASSINVPSSFTLELNGLQDWGAAASFSEYLFKHDAETVAFALFLDDESDPAASGTVSLAAGDFGGTAGEPLTFTASLPILGYPDITDSTGASLRPNGPVAATATGATAGTPGTWTPSGSTPPSGFAALTSASPAIVATPSTAWTTGQHMMLGDSTSAHWSGTAWATGPA